VSALLLGCTRADAPTNLSNFSGPPSSIKMAKKSFETFAIQNRLLAIHWYFVIFVLMSIRIRRIATSWHAIEAHFDGLPELYHNITSSSIV
jgi:hypothetical protein